MKKLITICLFMATTFTANAQTKEETIDWMQQKLKTYMYYDWFGAEAENVTINIDECFIFIQYTYSYYEKGKKDATPGFYYKIPTDGVEFKARRIEMKNNIQSINDKGHYTNSAAFGIKEGEVNLLERLNKAAAHLATFCPKKKETF